MMSEDDLIQLRLDLIEKRLDKLDGYLANGFKAFLTGVALLLWEPFKTLMITIGLMK
jgi:hypothetical protein